MFCYLRTNTKSRGILKNLICNTLVVLLVGTSCSVQQPQDRVLTKKAGDDDSGNAETGRSGAVIRTFVDADSLESLELAIKELDLGSKMFHDSKFAKSGRLANSEINFNSHINNINQLKTSIGKILAELSEKEIPLRTSIQENNEPQKSELSTNIVSAKDNFAAKEAKIANSTTKLSELKQQISEINLDVKPSEAKLTSLENYLLSLQTTLNSKASLNVAANSTIEQREAIVAGIEASKSAIKTRLDEKSTQLSGVDDSVNAVTNIKNQLTEKIDVAALTETELEAILKEFSDDIIGLDNNSIASISQALANSRNYSAGLSRAIADTKGYMQSHLSLIISIEKTNINEIKDAAKSLQALEKTLIEWETSTTDSKEKSELNGVLAYVKAAIKYVDNTSGKLQVTLDQQKSISDAAGKNIATKQSLLAATIIREASQEDELNQFRALSTQQKTALNSHNTNAQKVSELINSQRQIIALQAALITSLITSKSNIDVKIAEAEKYMSDAEAFIIEQKKEIERIKIQLRIAVDMSEKIIRSPESFQEMVKVLQNQPGDYKLGAHLNLENYTFPTMILTNAKISGNGFKIKNLTVNAMTLVSDGVKPNFEDITIEGLWTGNLVANNGVIQNSKLFFAPPSLGSGMFGKSVYNSGTGLKIRDSYVRLPNTAVFGGFLKPSVYDSVIETNSMVFTEVKRSYINLIPAIISLRLDLGDNKGSFVKLGGDAPYYAATLGTTNAECQFYHFGNSLGESRSRVHIPGCIKQGQVSLSRYPLAYTNYSLSRMTTRFPTNRSITESGDLKIVFSDLATSQVLAANAAPNTTKLDPQDWFMPASRTPALRDTRVFLKAQGLGQAWDLQRHFKFRKHESRLDNWGGQGEKWLQADDGQLYFIVPHNSALYRYTDGTTATFLDRATFMAYIHPDMATDPRKLFNLWQDESIHVASQRLLTSERVTPIPGRREYRSSSLDTYFSEAVPMTSSSGLIYFLMKEGDVYVSTAPTQYTLKPVFYGTNYLAARRFTLPAPFRYCSPASGPDIESFNGQGHPFPFQIRSTADLANTTFESSEAQLCASVDLSGFSSINRNLQILHGAGYSTSNISEAALTNAPYLTFRNAHITNATGKIRCNEHCIIENSNLDSVQQGIIDDATMPFVTIKTTTTKATITGAPRTNVSGNWGANGILEVMYRTGNLQLENLRIDVKCDVSKVPASGKYPINIISFGTELISYINNIRINTVDIHLDCPAVANLKYEPRLFWQPPQMDSMKRFPRNTTNVRFDNIRLHLPAAIADKLGDDHWTKANQIQLNDLEKDSFDLKSADLTVITGGTEKKFIYASSPE